MTLIWEMVLCLVPPSNSLDYVSDPLRAFCADTVIFKGFPQEYQSCMSHRCPAGHRRTANANPDSVFEKNTPILDCEKSTV